MPKAIFRIGLVIYAASFIMPAFEPRSGTILPSYVAGFLCAVFSLVLPLTGILSERLVIGGVPTFLAGLTNIAMLALVVGVPRDKRARRLFFWIVLLGVLASGWSLHENHFRPQIGYWTWIAGLGILWISQAADVRSA